MDRKKIICICGATATGKSSLALKIADQTGTEIVSCDSMQIYKYMNIGTAKPTKEEQAQVRHHMIDIIEPYENYSVSDYVTEAKKVIDDIHKRNMVPVICGGTGLYLDSLLRSNSFTDEIPTDPEMRKQLYDLLKKEGPERLFEKLTDIDPESAAEIHPNNTKRVIRAIEIFYTANRKKSELDKESQQTPSDYDFKVINIVYSDREVLKARINSRVDSMMKEGLEDEVKWLWDKHYLVEGTTASQAIGYKEMLKYLKGDSVLDAAVEEIKLRTRQYAKRQITWFRKYDSCIISPDRESMKEISEKIERCLSDF